MLYHAPAYHSSWRAVFPKPMDGGGLPRWPKVHAPNGISASHEERDVKKITLFYLSAETYTDTHCKLFHSAVFLALLPDRQERTRELDRDLHASDDDDYLRSSSAIPPFRHQSYISWPFALLGLRIAGGSQAGRGILGLFIPIMFFRDRA